MVECPKCGGNGGQDASEVMIGERGWLACYFCGETGFVTVEAMMAYEKAEEDALADIHSRSFQDWDDDGSWNPQDDQAAMADYHNEATSTWKDFEPDYRLTGEDIPF